METKMKSLTKLAVVILPLALLTACATTSDLEAVKASAAAAQSSADSALAAANAAQSTADSATRTANDAEGAALIARESADSAQKSVDECCAKIDRMFEKAMSK